jgi:hypothetical protein
VGMRPLAVKAGLVTVSAVPPFPLLQAVNATTAMTAASAAFTSGRR